MPALDATNVSAFCSGIDLEQERPVVDLSNVTFVTPFALVYVGMFLRHFNSQGKWFDWARPVSESVEDYLAGMRFYERFQFNPEVVEAAKQLRHDRDPSLNDIIDIRREEDVGERIASRSADLLRAVPIPLGLVADAVSELVDNFAQHSGTDLPATFTMQWFPRRRHLSLALGDCGLGIRRTLQRNPEYEYVAQQPDEDAIVLALRQRVSCQPGHGMGLTEVVENVIAAGGWLTIASGGGRVIIDKAGKLYRQHAGCELPGVQLAVHFPT